MKVSNLKRASELLEELRIINVKIETAQKAKRVSMLGGNSFETSTKSMKYGGDVILQSVKPLFLEALGREKADIEKEINGLD